MNTNTKMLMIAVVLLTGTPVLAGDDPAPVDTVVVFADRAEVTRVATATCQSGSAKVTFPLLPVPPLRLHPNPRHYHPARIFLFFRLSLFHHQ